MVGTKEVERTELHRTIWRTANDLSGSVGDSGFKSYVLGLLFYRFVSGHLTTWADRGEPEAGGTDLDYHCCGAKDTESIRGNVATAGLVKNVEAMKGDSDVETH